MSHPPFDRNFFKRHILPGLLVFLIPVFSVWFFRYAGRRFDGELLVSLERQIDSDTHASGERKKETLDFFRATPVSRIMASRAPEAATAQAAFASVRNRYATFRWMQRIAWLCLGGVLLTFVVVGISVAFSFRSQAAQYWAIRIGWPVLRTSALIQVLGQGVLAAFLSFWVTAIFFDLYSVKLIAIFSILALGAVGGLVTAIFRKVDDKCEVSGQVVGEQDAPALWQRVRELAARLDTAAPDRIIAGIDANFFVTEHPVRLGDEIHEGRTLFVSLPMLKILNVEEADAVLGHELAHFSGQDTLWSRKISPLMAKFGIYLQTLNAGLSAVVAQFMFLFWKLYMLSIRRLSREREFRADGLAGNLTSAGAMKNALIKVAGYCAYRAQTVSSIIGQNSLHPEQQLAEMLEQGFPASLKTFTSNEQAARSETPHPFDSHPPLNQRLESLGFAGSLAAHGDGVQAAPGGTWYDAIPAATTIEQEMWAEQQQAIQTYHSHDLAWRLLPTTPEEEAHVLAHFPMKTFRKKDGTEATLHYDRIHLSSWDRPVMFKNVEAASLDDHFMKKRPVLICRDGADGKATQVKFHPLEFADDSGEKLLAAFQHYYGRHKTAEMRSRNPS